MTSPWTLLDERGQARKLAHDEAEAEKAALGLSVVDARMLDHRMPTSLTCSVLPRDACTLVSVDGFACAVGEHRLLTSQPDARHMAEASRRLVSTGPGDFRSTVIDTVLDVHLSAISERYGLLTASLEPVVANVATDATAARLQQLRVLKTRTARQTAEAEGFREALRRALENDASDMPTLEVYLSRVEHYTAALRRHGDLIADTESYVTMVTDGARNDIIKFELLMSIATFAVSTVGAVAGLFGQNLDNAGWGPPAQGSFAYVTAITCAVAGASFGALFVWCRARRLV